MFTNRRINLTALANIKSFHSDNDTPIYSTCGLKYRFFTMKRKPRPQRRIAPSTALRPRPTTRSLDSHQTQVTLMATLKQHIFVQIWCRNVLFVIILIIIRRYDTVRINYNKITYDCSKQHMIIYLLTTLKKDKVNFITSIRI